MIAPKVLKTEKIVYRETAEIPPAHKEKEAAVVADTIMQRLLQIDTGVEGDAVVDTPEFALTGSGRNIAPGIGMSQPHSYTGSQRVNDSLAVPPFSAFTQSTGIATVSSLEEQEKEPLNEKSVQAAGSYWQPYAVPKRATVTKGTETATIEMSSKLEVSVPIAPSQLRVAIAVEAIRSSWAGQADVWRYAVYRKLEAIPQPGEPDTLRFETLGSKTFFQHNGLIGGATYYFAIAAINDDLVEGPLSAIVGAIPTTGQLAQADDRAP
ncbi:MAG: hypothetical protein ABW168_27795 [Sedimenticola sp.]